MPQIAWFYNQTRDANFRQGKIRLIDNSDGTAAYTRLKARVNDGVVETEQAPEIHMPQIAWFYNQTRDQFPPRRNTAGR